MNGLTYLILAIISEVIATTVLKASDGFSRLYPSIVVVVGYCFSFWALSQVVKVMPLGIAYASFCCGCFCLSTKTRFTRHRRYDINYCRRLSD